MKLYQLIDRSGSMRPRWSETMSALNEFTNSFVEKKGFKSASVTVAAFDWPTIAPVPKEMRFTVLRDHMSLNDWMDISHDEISPDGMTPLFDAIGRLDQIIRKDNPKKAIISIVTDGIENMSVEHDQMSARSIVERWQEKYDLSFLGADFDAFGQGVQLGIPATSILNMVASNYGAATHAMAAKAEDYSKGILRGYTEAERDAAAGRNNV